jgi:hypothetical protein
MSSSKSDLSTELIQYIQKQIQTPDIETYKILYTVLRLYVYALCKIQRIKPEETYSIACADTMLYIFKTMYHYTKHAKVSIDMAEHVIVIFEDCIYTSMSMNTLQIYISEIKEIIIEKTIGPIFLYKPTFATAETTPKTGQKHEFYMETLDIMTTFIRNLFVRFIHLHRSKQVTIQKSIQGSLFGSIHSRCSVKSVKSESESAIEAYTVFDDEYNEEFIDKSENKNGDGNDIGLSDITDDLYATPSNKSLIVDVDTIEEHMLSIMIMLHIIVDKWVILSNGKHAEYTMTTLLDSVHQLHDMIPFMNNLKVRLECIYYTASLYPSIDEAFDQINSLLDEYDEENDCENETDEWTTEYINSSIAIKEYRPFQLRVYRIYEQKNK